MKNKIVVLYIAIAVLIAVAGMATWAMQIDNARNELKKELGCLLGEYNESLKVYGNLSAEYNQTSEELNEIKQTDAYNTSEELEQIKDWLREERIYRVYENVGVGNIFIKEEGTKAIISRYSSNKEGRYLLYLTTGYNKDNEVFIDVKTFNPINGKETERWNCTGEECLMPILRDIEDDGTWYKWKGIWLQKDSNYATAIQRIDDTIIQGKIRINEGELTMEIGRFNETHPYNELWNCSSADCLNMT